MAIPAKYSRFISESSSYEGLDYLERVLKDVFGSSDSERKFSNAGFTFIVTTSSTGRKTDFNTADELVDFLKNSCREVLSNAYMAFENSGVSSQTRWARNLEDLYDIDDLRNANWFSEVYIVTAWIKTGSNLLNLLGCRDGSEFMRIEVDADGEVTVFDSKLNPIK